MGVTHFTDPVEFFMNFSQVESTLNKLLSVIHLILHRHVSGHWLAVALISLSVCLYLL